MSTPPRVAIVTGAGTGIGRAVAIGLLEGDYSLTIKATGMRTQTHTGNLGPLEAFELDFMLATDKKKTTPKTPPKKDTTAKKPK